MTWRVPIDRERHDRQARLDREQKAAGLEARHAAVGAARALGVDDERQPVGHERPPSLQDARAIGMLSVDEQVAAALQVPAEHGKPRERFLRDDPELIRQRREDHRRVVDALVVRHEDVRRAGREALEALDGDVDAGRLQNQPRPRARAAVREVAAPIERGSTRATPRRARSCRP